MSSVSVIDVVLLSIPELAVQFHVAQITFNNVNYLAPESVRQFGNHAQPAQDVTSEDASGTLQWFFYWTRGGAIPTGRH